MKRKLFIPIVAILIVFAFGFTRPVNSPIPADYVYTLTIPDAHVAEMVQVFSRGYEALITDEETGEQVANPVTRSEYAIQEFDRKVKGMIRQEVRRYRKGLLPPVSQTDIFEN